MGKSLVGSKLSWVGVITALVSGLTAIQNSDLIANNPELAGWVGVAIGGLVLVLRVFGTSQPIKSVLPKSK